MSAPPGGYGASREHQAPIEGSQGQTAKRQLDGLADLGAALSGGMKLPVGDLWTMQNGYALGTQMGLDAIARHLGTLATDQIDVLRRKLRIGIHRDVEVTEVAGPDRPRVSQSFCSALPVAYSRVPPAHWEPFALLVLEAAYEATMWATVLNAQRGASNVVFLTLLGGGAFGNHSSWIHAAMRRALEIDEALRSRREACELRDTIEGDNGDRRRIPVIVARALRSLTRSKSDSDGQACSSWRGERAAGPRRGDASFRRIMQPWRPRNPPGI